MRWLLAAWIFFLPLQTRWIVSEGRIAGGVSEYGTFSMYATDVLLFVALVMFIMQRQRVRLARGLFLSAGLFFLTILFSAFNAGDTGVALSIASRFFIAMCAWLLLSSQRRFVPLAAVALVISSVTQTVIAWFQFAQQSIAASTVFGMASHAPSVLGDIVVETGEGRFLRAYGTLPHPNMLAAWLVIGLIAVTGLYVRTAQWRWRIACMTALIIISSGLLLTFSRSGLFAWFATLLALATFTFVREWKERTMLSMKVLKIFVVSLLFFAVFRGVLAPIVETRASVSGRLERQSFSDRVQQLKDARQLVPEAWFLGVGAGNYTRAVYAFVDSGREWWQYQPVHNVWILAFVELGVFGFCLFLLFLFSLVRRMIHAVGAALHHSYETLPWSLFTTLMFFALSLIALVDHFLWSLGFGIMVSWTVLGLFLGSSEEY